jgi:hypothetical protein
LAAYEQGCAAISLEGLPDGETPRLKVRRGMDMKQFVIAVDRSEEVNELPVYPPSDTEPAVPSEIMSRIDMNQYDINASVFDTDPLVVGSR